MNRIKTSQLREIRTRIVRHRTEFNSKNPRVNVLKGLHLNLQRYMHEIGMPKPVRKDVLETYSCLLSDHISKLMQRGYEIEVDS